MLLGAGPRGGGSHPGPATTLVPSCPASRSPRLWHHSPPWRLLSSGSAEPGGGEEGPRAVGLQEALSDPPRVLCPQCLAAGSIIMNRELESMAMRPLAKELTRSLEDVRGALRDQALRDLSTYTEKMREALRHFDVLFAEFELR